MDFCACNARLSRLFSTGHIYSPVSNGLPVGHVALPAPEAKRDLSAWGADEAPESDIAWGRFSNLETLLENGNHTRLNRISLKGLLKVPSTPLVVGFSANIGTDHGINPSHITQKAEDDLRCLIGAKFDVGKNTSHLSNHAF